MVKANKTEWTLWVATLLLVLAGGCAKQTPTDAASQDDDDLQISALSLDFGAADSVKTFTITTPRDRVVDWRLRRTETWLSFDGKEDGTGTTTISVRLNRALMPIGDVSDTIVITGLRRGKALATTQAVETTKKIPVSAQKPATSSTSMQALLQQLAGNGVQLPPGLDSAASLLAAMNVETEKTGSAAVKTAMAMFYANRQPFMDAGALTLRAGSVPLPRMDSVALKKQQFTYKNPATGQTSSGYYYLPGTGVVTPGGLLLFDGSTYQSFRVYGTSSFAGFRDSVLSVVTPTLSSPSAGGSVSRSAGLTLRWSPSADASDSVYAVVMSTADSAKIASSLPANDNAGTTSVSATALSRLPAGAATVFVVRYRYALRGASGTDKRGVLSLAQRSVSITLY